MEFIDIAGLVEGASKGEGLGNQFLGHIRATDAICHVVRCFDDPEVVHVAGGVNPLHDIDIINTELLLADLDTVEKRNTKVEKRRQGHRRLTRSRPSTPCCKSSSPSSTPASPPAPPTSPTTSAPSPASSSSSPPSPSSTSPTSTRPASPTGNAYTAAVEKRAAEEGAQVVRICGAMEAEIAQLDPAERAEFLEGLGLAEPGLNRLIHSAYRLLDLITYFTAGVQEVRAWTIRRGTKAPGAAGVIHSDFEKGFIKADCLRLRRPLPPTAPNRPSKKPASSAPKAKSTSSKTATSSSSNSTYNK